MGTANYRVWAEAMMSSTGTGIFSLENVAMTAYNHLIFRLTVEEQKSVLCSKDNTFKSTASAAFCIMHEANRIPLG